MNDELIKKILNTKTVYGDLFPNSKTLITKKYKDYCKIIHPDNCLNPDAAEAFMKLQDLYKKAQDALTQGIWEATNYIEYHTINHTTLQIKYLHHFTFEIGECYICKNYIFYVLDSTKEKYYKNYIKQVKSLKYADSKMKDTFKILMPEIYKTTETKEHKYILILKKPEDVYPLELLFTNGFNNDIPIDHLNWITSRLLNISCFLKYNNQVSNGIDIRNLFVNPEKHGIFLYGSFWYTMPYDDLMLGTTNNIFNLMSPKAKSEKISKYSTDIESIKSIGRKYAQKDTPPLILDYYKSGSLDDPYQEFAKWDDVLNKVYKKRCFKKIGNNIIHNIYK